MSAPQVTPTGGIASLSDLNGDLATLHEQTAAAVGAAESAVANSALAGGFAAQASTSQAAAAASAAAARDDQVVASTSASSAATSAAASALSAGEAGASAIAAGAPIFADTTAGLAGTVSGDLFFVPANGGLDVYENVSGVATYSDTLAQPRFVVLSTFTAAVAAGYDPQPGTVLSVAGVVYERVTGAVSVTGLPGWVKRFDAADVTPQGSDSPAALLGAAKSVPEGLVALGIGPRVITVTGDGTAYIVSPSDFTPAVHYVTPGATGVIELDLSSLAIGRTYRIVNAGAFGGVVGINIDGTKYFKSDWISPSVTDLRSFNIVAGEAIEVLRYSSAVFVATKTPSGLWVTSGLVKYRRDRDGKYDVIFTRTGTINGSLESTSNLLPTGFSLDAASVVSVTMQPRTDGGAHPDLVPQVTKMGTAHSLAANQFAIRNPNVAAIDQPITVYFKNVAGVTL